MLKKLLISVIVIGFFSGCVTDKLYNAGKTVYIKGKEVVIKNYDDLPEDIQEKLKRIDEYSTKYDETRGEIRSKVGNKNAK